MSLREWLEARLRESGVDFESEDLAMVDRWAGEIAADDRKLRVLASLISIKVARRGLAEAVELRGVVEHLLRVGLLFL